jgi:hypothetical protein
MTRFLALLTTFALAVSPAAAAVGPALPNMSGSVEGAGEVSYVTALRGSATLLTRRVEGHIVARTTLSGGWGVPMITLGAGSLGGLSPNGRVLVLGDDVRPEGTLRARSRFAVIDTRSLRLMRTIALQGDYSFDALSPQGRWLYLIHHVLSTDNRYQVLAYDLRTGVLLPRVIADKRQAGWLMSGYPVSRATTANGRWVYTLYEQSDNYPFVHALDTVSRTAVCIGLPWKWARTGADVAIGGAKLTLSGHKLEIAGGPGAPQGFSLDTRTFRVKSG